MQCVEKSAGPFVKMSSPSMTPRFSDDIPQWFMMITNWLLATSYFWSNPLFTKGLTYAPRSELPFPQLLDGREAWMPISAQTPISNYCYIYIYTYIHVYIIFPYIPIISILSIPMWFVDGHSGPFQILFIKRCQSSIDFSRFSPLVLEISRDFLDVRLVSDSQHFNRSFRKNPPLFLFRSKGYLGSSEDARWGARRSPLRILAALANWKQIPGIYRSFSHEKIAIDRGCPIVIFDYWRVINIYIYIIIK